MNKAPILITECPRDAMQGWKNIISTEKKIDYLTQLLKVGYETLDFGSFVNPKVMPQMADTVDVLKSIEPYKKSTKLLAIIANIKGAEQAIEHNSIDILGFPFSISETFQQRNTNKGIQESFEQVKIIQEMSVKHGKELLIYISMGFGNPYNDPYSPEIVSEWVKKLSELGIRQFALSDTIGVSHPELITNLFSALIPTHPDKIIGAHFHSTPHTAIEKIKAAYEAGCRHFDSSINGIGGCPMAKDELVGNLATESLVQFMDRENIPYKWDMIAFLEAQKIAQEIFI